MDFFLVGAKTVGSGPTRTCHFGPALAALQLIRSTCTAHNVSPELLPHGYEGLSAGTAADLLLLVNRESEQLQLDGEDPCVEWCHSVSPYKF